MAKSFLKRLIYMIKVAAKNQTKKGKIVIVGKNLTDTKANVIKAYQQVEIFMKRLAPRTFQDFEVSTQRLLANLQDTPAFDEQLQSQGYTPDGFISKVQSVFNIEVIFNSKYV